MTFQHIKTGKTKISIRGTDSKFDVRSVGAFSKRTVKNKIKSIFAKGVITEFLNIDDDIKEEKKKEQSGEEIFHAFDAQVDVVIDYIKSIQEKFNISSSDIELLGHSLGGMIAQKASVAVSCTSTAYNTFGFDKLDATQKEIKHIEGNSTLHTLDDDVLDWLMVLINTKHSGKTIKHLPVKDDLSKIDSHSLINMYETLHRYSIIQKIIPSVKVSDIVALHSKMDFKTFDAFYLSAVFNGNQNETFQNLSSVLDGTLFRALNTSYSAKEMTSIIDEYNLTGTLNFDNVKFSDKDSPTPKNNTTCRISKNNSYMPS
jgi:hypothetical protein